MENRLVAENCKAVTLDNGREMIYCEFGEENEEVIVTGAFYFHTFNKFLKELAKKYRVVGFVMRTSGDGEIFDKDGDVNWTRQWGEEIYQATQKLGLEKFHFVGKCHGIMPGWYMMKEHPEVLLSMSSISQSLHAYEQDKDDWTAKQKELGPKFMLQALKRHDLLPEKVKEAQLVQSTGTVGANPVDPKVGYYGSHAEEICDSYEEVKEFIKTIKTPVLHLYPTDDILYWDFKTANEAAMYEVPGAKTVLLQGERHLLEMDIPKLMAREVMFFIEGTKLERE